MAIDPLSAVASTLDLDFDKSNAEFVAFYDKLVQPLVDRGLSILANRSRRPASGPSDGQPRGNAARAPDGDGKGWE